MCIKYILLNVSEEVLHKTRVAALFQLHIPLHNARVLFMTAIKQSAPSPSTERTMTAFLGGREIWGCKGQVSPRLIMGDEAGYGGRHGAQEG